MNGFMAIGDVARRVGEVAPDIVMHGRPVDLQCQKVVAAVIEDDVGDLDLRNIVIWFLSGMIEVKGAICLQFVLV